MFNATYKVTGANTAKNTITIRPTAGTMLKAFAYALGPYAVIYGALYIVSLPKTPKVTEDEMREETQM